jgi:signal transduction histidine kinase
MSAGAAGFFRKPFDGEALLAAIEAVIRPRNGQASSPGFVAAPQEMLSSQHCVEASPDARTHLKRDREGYTMTAVQSVRGVRCAHAPPQESDSDLAPAIKNLLEISLALLGSEELTLRLYDQSVSAPPALACESSVQTAARSGEGGIRTGAGEAGPSVQRFAAEAAVLREALTGPNLRSRLLVDSSGRVLGVLTARFAHSDDLSEGERRAFDFSAEALEIVISSAGREEQARTSADDLIKRNAELESSNTRLVCSNQELERFATAASHDLQEPLRTISMYAELLSVKHTVLLDEDAVGLVNSISQSARSLSALLRDLMTYAKVEVTGDASTLPAVDLNRVVQKAIRNVGTSAAECGASITVDPLPTV